MAEDEHPSPGEVKPPAPVHAETHKHNPFHSLRDFFTEIGTIVLGVVIALAAEQAVEWWHWQNRVADARASILQELRDDDAPQAFTRVAAEFCFQRQLDALRDAIEAERPRREIMALVSNFKVPVRTWDMASWNAMLASGIASHFPPDELTRLTLPYSRLPVLAQAATEELHDWQALRPDRHLGDKLTPAAADAMLAAVRRLRSGNHHISRFSDGLLAELKENGIEIPAALQQQILSDLRAHLQGCVITPVFHVGDPADNSQTGFLR